MRSGAARGHHGFFHEAAFYSSDQEFLEIVVPFLTDGLEAGEPVVSAFARHNQTLLRDVFGAGSGIRFIDAGLLYARPASAVHRYRRMLGEYVKAGVRQIRTAGEIPHPGTGAPWDWWARYEAAVNRAYDDYPLWGLCPYDTRLVPGASLEDVRRTHPYIATRTGHLVNPGHVEPGEFLTGHTSSWRDRLEDDPPLARFTDPTPAQVRDTLLAAGGSTLLSANDLRGLVLGASEAVTNAVRHGVPPVTVRLWCSPRRIVVAVTDTGPGPGDPYAGLVPPGGGGMGLWLAHQMCGYVTFRRGREGFTIRLVAGRVEP